MNNPLTSENDTLVAAMPSASVATITSDATGVFRADRTPKIRSLNMSNISGAALLRSAPGDPFPVRDEMFGRAPRERLDGERRVARAARAHHRRAEHAEVRRLVCEPPAIDDVRLGAVAHARAAVRVRRHAHRAAHRRALHGHCAGRAIPLLHLVLRERGDLPLVVLVFGSDA